MESDSFYKEVRRMVRRIPRGKVVTYGQLAAILGRPRAARAVGSALRRLSGPLAREVPWHRVLNAAGRISFRDDSWPELQRELLEREGIRFKRGGAVDLERTRWAGPKKGPRDLFSRRRVAPSRQRSALSNT